MNNPYSWNTVNPDIYYGRDQLVNEMLSGLPGSPRFSFGLSGGRRMGKTTLLRKIEKEIKSNIRQWDVGGLLVIPIYVDSLALPEAFRANDIWIFIAKEIIDALGGNENFKIHDFDGFKLEILATIINAPKRPRIIVLFDEIERIVSCDWGRTFFDHWRSLLSNSPDLSEYFTAVFSGAREMDALRRDDMGSPLKDILEWRNLRVLEYEDTKNLMQEPINHTWPPKFIEQVYKKTGGHPMLIQYIMQYVCSKDIDKADEAIDEAEKKFSKERAWQFNEWWHKYCSPMAQSIYSQLPKDGKALSLSVLSRKFGLYEANIALEILQHVGLAAEEDDGFSFRFSGTMFRDWYHRQISETLYTSDPEHNQVLQILEQEEKENYLECRNIFQNHEIEKYHIAITKMKAIFEGILDARYSIDKSIRPISQHRVLIKKIQDLEADEAMELASEYEVLSEFTNKLSATVQNLRNAPANIDPLINEIYQLFKRWESIIVRLATIDKKERLLDI